ncbi:hypothetical protein [Polaribacter sp. M15]
MKKLKNDEFSGKLILALILIVVIIGIFYQYYGQNEIENNKENTTGEVIEFLHKTNLDYAIIYEYFVEGKRYTNQIGISFFKCENGKKGCLGEKFTVYYSKKNPKFSKIDLGKYNEFQNTVDFTKILE